MKKIIQLVILSTIIIIILIKTPVIFFVSQLIYSSPCDQPLNYKTGFIDPRFHLSQQEFLTDIKQAIEIWNKAVGKNLFIYNMQDDALNINLIFDERQSLNNQIGNLEGELKNEKNSIDPQVSEYENLSSDFKQRLSSLNTQISYWNSKGGAPSNEYEKLKNEQQSLVTEADKLNRMAKNLNRSSDLYNAQVGELNQTVDTYNTALQFRPEEGIFDPQNNRINIYFNISRTELVHTLAHELGHALGLAHIANQQAIMFPKTTQIISASSDDILALEKICKKRTLFDRIGEKTSILLNHVSLGNTIN